ncbi:MAG: alcohol dehydrogenase [Phycisphaeraceae bacterium]|nr:alcohol dehydrogenase [Phycisphaeraceae bacterium]
MDEVVLQEPGRFVLRDGPEPEAGAGEAIVRIRRIGVCGSDLHAFAGRMPFVKCPRILGHELGAEVVEAPPNDRDVEVGSRCAVEPYLYCGACPPCLMGRTNCCTTLKVLGIHTDGGMRPHIAVPMHCLFPSRRLELDQLALVETLGIGAQAVARSGLARGESALVVGIGPIGLATYQFAAATGASVRVLELSPQRRAFVTDALGADVVESDDGVYDAVLDATGNRRAMEASFERVAHGGRLVFVGLIDDEVTFRDPLFHQREMTIYASRNSAGLFPRIIEMIESGQIDTRPWITHRMTLRGVTTDFADVTTREGLVKAMIEVA